MNKAAREARNAYKREWQRTHPENVKKSQEKYWTKKAQELQRAKEAAASDTGASTAESE